MNGKISRTFGLGAVLCLAVAGLHAQVNNQFCTSRVVIGLSQAQAAAPTAEQLNFRVNGKPATVTSVAPLRDADNPLEIVLLVDSTARNDLQVQLGELRDFTRALPQGARLVLAYIVDDKLMLTGSLTNNPAVVEKALKVAVPSGNISNPSLSVDTAEMVSPINRPVSTERDIHTGSAGGSLSNPYASLRLLAQNWPSKNTNARRIVVLVTDGVDPNHPSYDPNNVQVQSASADATRAHLQVYSILRSWGDNSAGKYNLSKLTEATGGEVFGLVTQGGANSFAELYQQVLKDSQNQYLVDLTLPFKFKAREDVLPLDLKTTGLQGKVVAPRQTLVAGH